MSSPDPRPEVSDPGLWRPDWTTGTERLPAKLWLDKNENSDPAMAAVVRSVFESLPPDVFRTYPESAQLYRKLADHCGLSPENLLLSAGSDGAIRAVFEAYVAPGDGVIHTVPTFAMYAVYSRMYGAKVRPLEYRPSNAGPVLAVDDFVAAIDESGPKLVSLANPDSPTGTTFSPAEMRAIIAAAGRAGALMLIDEAYYPFHAETVLPWVNDYDHLVVTRSTGKAWGLAGFRIGYAAAAPGVAKILHKVRAMYETNSVAVAVFERMLDFEDEMRASVARLEAGKRGFLDAMRALGFRTLDGKGNFLHVAFGIHADAVHAALDDLVYYRKDFNEPCLKGFSRFSATTPELFQPIIQRIEKVVKA
jgi:histidinol-phosphate aminotransferase